MSAVTETSAVLLVDSAGLAKMLHISPRHLARLDSGGKIPMARRLGRLKRWPTSEIQSWIDAGCPERGRWEAMKRQKK